MTTTTLSAWTQSQFSALFDSSAPHASDAMALGTVFDGALSPDVQITTNHEPMTRDEFLDTVRSHNAAAVETTIEYKDVMEIPQADGEPHEVCLFASSPKNQC